jgi:gas vesicle protein
MESPDHREHPSSPPQQERSKSPDHREHPSSPPQQERSKSPTEKKKKPKDKDAKDAPGKSRQPKTLPGMCTKHGDKVTRFCVTCMEPACAECDHVDHNVSTTAAAARQMRSHVARLCGSSMYDDAWPALTLTGESALDLTRPRTATLLHGPGGAEESDALSPDGAGSPISTEHASRPDTSAESKESEGAAAPVPSPSPPVLAGPPTADLEAQSLAKAIQSELDALPGRADQAKEQISALEKQAIAAVKARCKQMVSQVNSALKTKTSALTAELERARSLREQVLRECSAAQAATGSLADEELVTSHAQLQKSLAEAFAALRGLGVVPNTDATLELAVGIGGVDKVIEALGAVVTEAGSAPTGTTTAAQAASGPPAVMQGFGAKELVAALSRQGKFASVVVPVCVALKSLVSSDAGEREAVITAGAVPALISTLALHNSNAAVVEAASGGLHAIGCSRAAPPPALAAAVEPLLAAISVHSALPGVLVQTCSALRGAIAAASSANAQGIATLPLAIDDSDHPTAVTIPPNTVATFVHLLAAHSSNGAVLEHALFALGALLDYDPDEAAPELLRCRGFEAIVSILSAFSKDPCVVQAACSALGAAAISVLAKPAFLAAGGVTVLSGVLATYSDSPSVVAAACHAYSRAARGGVDVQTALGDNRILATLSALVEAGDDREVVSEAACCALRDATEGHASNRAAVLAAGGVVRIVSVLVAHSGRDALLEAAAGALRSAVAGSIESIAVAVRAGAIPALADCLEEHSGSPGVIEQVRIAVRAGFRVVILVRFRSNGVCVSVCVFVCGVGAIEMLPSILRQVRANCDPTRSCRPVLLSQISRLTTLRLWCVVAAWNWLSKPSAPTPGWQGLLAKHPGPSV